MREFAGRKLRSITTQDIQRFLAAIDREDVSARTVNIHRQLLHSIFEHARRTDVFALRQPGRRDQEAPRRRRARLIETFEPDELRAIAEAARSSLHRTRPAHGYSEETNAEWQRINEQDAALFIVAACTGLRLGELLALRWSGVDSKAGALTVSRAMSAGEESSTKSRRPRTVPLAEQAATELQGSRERPRFTSHTFCDTPSAVWRSSASTLSRSRT